MTIPKLWKYPIDFYARREHFIDHMLNVWNAMKGARGKFFICLPPDHDNVLCAAPNTLGPLMDGSGQQSG